MKKFFVLMLALALFVPAVASAQIKWNGQFNVFGYAFDNAPFAEDGTSNTYSRLILGASFDLAENIEGNASLMYFSTWGDNYLAGQQIDNSNDTGILSTTKLIEANVVFKNLFDNDRISAKVGRQFYDGGTLFYVGPRDLIWSYFILGPMGMPSYFIQDSGMDGVVLTYDNKEDLKVDLGYSKLVNEDTDSGYKINTTFVNTKYTLNDMWNVQGYFYDFEMANVGGTDYVRFEYLGAKPEFKYNSLLASVELVQCFADDDGSMFSTRHTGDGYRAKIDLSYDLSPLKLRGMYLMTGTEFYISPMQHNYLGLIFTGMSGMLTVGGMPADVYIDCMNLGADYTINKFNFSVDYFRIGLPRDDAYKMYEVDFMAKYNYKENIAFKGAIAYMSEENSAYHDMAYFMGIDYKFGSK
ncbi:MAG: hypothetical protein PHR82_03390 [Endomicrobiaceae bacterium]|nr:hypothetical protein [Endomicrobiaceae bacterium]